MLTLRSLGGEDKPRADGKAASRDQTPQEGGDGRKILRRPLVTPSPLGERGRRRSTLVNLTSASGLQGGTSGNDGNGKTSAAAVRLRGSIL